LRVVGFVVVVVILVVVVVVVVVVVLIVVVTVVVVITVVVVGLRQAFSNRVKLHFNKFNLLLSRKFL
jgi:hypothetical protein